MLRDSVIAFVDDEALSRGAAIAFYAASALAPTLFIAVAIAGLFFGRDAAQATVAAQVHGLIGPQAADLLQAAIKNVGATSRGIAANVFGILILIAVASGVFTEMQAALNAIWKMPAQRRWYVAILISRVKSLGLVGALGFLLLTSMVLTALINAASGYIDAHFPMGAALLNAVNFVVSFVLVTVMFAAIYKVLPDRSLTWRDCLTGAIVTALLFLFGQFLIGLYIASNWAASLYGVAGGLIVLMFWIYYSAEIFLLGAEFTKLYAQRYGSLGRRRKGR